MLDAYAGMYFTKYDSPFTAYLDTLTAEDEFGTTAYGGQWHGLYGRNVLVEDAQGFVSRQSFTSAAAARTAFDAAADSYYEEDYPL